MPGEVRGHTPGGRVDSGAEDRGEWVGGLSAYQVMMGAVQRPPCVRLCCRPILAPCHSSFSTSRYHVQSIVVCARHTAA